MTASRAYVHTLDEIQGLNAEGLRMRATCPTCSRDGRKVWPAIKQATRQEPAIFLGWSSYCPECMGGFQVEQAQTVLA